MSRRIQRLLAGALLSLAAPLAGAAITCSVTLTDVLTVYDPNSAVVNVTTGSYTIACNRLVTDANTQAWRLGVNNGTNFGGGSNRVVRTGTQRYDYETYQPGGGTLWGNTNTTRFTGTLAFGASLTASVTGAFEIRMTAGQVPPPAKPAGTYTDSVIATLENSTGGTTFDTTPFTVTVRTDNWCHIPTPPGSIAFTYTSFQAAPAAASTNYGIRCTSALPYTMALDATTGTLLGLTYNLALSNASSTGTGATQTFSINGTIPAGQAGTCAAASCSGSQTRTLTLTW